MSDTVIVLLMIAAPLVTIALAYLLGSIIRFGAGDEAWPLASRTKRIGFDRSGK